MPTKRATTLSAAALLLYFFASQTQVGWLYVMAALIAGLVVAAWLLSRFALPPLSITRQVGSPEDDLHEGDQAVVRLAVTARRGRPAQLNILEICPLAGPTEPAHRQHLFIPRLAVRQPLDHQYEVTLYRRGLHSFPPVQVATKAPFGLFKRRRAVSAPSPALILPEVRPLDGLPLLDRQLAAQITHARAGIGSEVIGVRAYRSGDSPRHIHWRSVARRGTLISKEFAQEARPGITLALDLMAHPYPDLADKHNPFELMIKTAASIGDYALQQRFPLYVAADQAALPHPRGPLTRPALMEWLARAQPTGTQALHQAVQGASFQAFVALLLPWPDASVEDLCLGLLRRQSALLVVLAEPASFAAPGPAAGPLATTLEGLGAQVCLLNAGEDWAARLQHTQLTEEIF